jgi:predicted dehydrogenase
MFITTTGEAPGTNRFEVSGTKGKLVCEDGKLLFYKNIDDSAELIKSSPLSFVKAKPEIIEVETDGQNPQHAGIINNFTAALLGKEELFVSGTDGIAGVELMNAIELSGWRGGERVSLPVNEDEYLEELNKHRATSRLKTNVASTVSNTEGSY